MYGLQSKLVDVETAFLRGDLEEEVYMDCPEGMVDIGEDEALLLKSTIYGLVQNARQYYKKATSILKYLGFTGGTVDPCLFYQETEKGKVYFGLYVDGNF